MTDALGTCLAYAALPRCEGFYGGPILLDGVHRVVIVRRDGESGGVTVALYAMPQDDVTVALDEPQ
jgi:hypothetical protein